MFKQISKVLSLAGLLVCGTAFAADLTWSGLRAERYGSLFTPGETVKFIAMTPLPGELKSLTGTIYSSDGAKVDEKTVTGTEFKTGGWTWMPAVTGLYDIEFNGITADGKSVSFQEKFLAKVKTDSETYTRPRYVVGVVPRPPVMSQRSPLFGFSNQLDDLELYPLADMLGLSFARLHAIGWGCQFTDTALALEPEQGKYNWERLDKHVNAMKKYGFTMAGNILYTPKWASPYPEKNNINICVREFSSYAPAKMVYLENFLKALIARYGKDIRIWEIWNEPSVKGGSCFWSDTPENYMLLLKTAAETLRREQPGTELWLGGVGTNPSYFRFYQIITKLGAAQYYDKLALHGRTSDPQEYFNIDKELGLKTKPLVSSESHDVLQREGPIEKNETEIAAMLIQNMLLKIKAGHERIAIFEFRNLAEMESLPFYGKHNQIVHASGLFRRRPITEPRLCAIVYANLINQLKTGAKIAGEYRLEKASLNLVQFDFPAQPPLLLLWNDGKTPAVIPDALRSCMTAASTITDWEGKAADKNNVAFAPGKVYYLSALNPQAVKKLPVKEIIGAQAAGGAKAGIPSALGGKARLFDPASGKLNTANINWITSGWQKGGFNGAGSPESFQAKFAVSGSAQGLDLVVSVKDSKAQFAKADDPAWWDYDSVQFAIDTRGRRSTLDMLEFAVSSVNGEPVIRKLTAPALDGDLPTGLTPVGNPVKNATVKISHANGETVYRIHIEGSELFPYAYTPEKPLAFSLLVNNNDGAGRLGWLEWGGGIGKSKDPSEYGNIYFVDPAANLLGSSQFMNGKGWYSWVAAEDKGRASVMLTNGNAVVVNGGPDANGAANINNIQLIRDIKLKNEQSYLLCFTATAAKDGNLSVEYLMAKNPWPRFSTTMCRLISGQRDYMLVIRPRNTKSLPADAPLSLRVFLGELPAGTVTFSNAGLYQLGE